MNLYPLWIMHLRKTKYISRRTGIYLDQNSGENLCISNHLVTANNVGYYCVKPTSIVKVDVMELTKQRKVLFSHSSTLIRGGWACLSAWCESYFLNSNMNSVFLLLISGQGYNPAHKRTKFKIRQIDFFAYHKGRPFNFVRPFQGLIP